MDDEPFDWNGSSLEKVMAEIQRIGRERRKALDALVVPETVRAALDDPQAPTPPLDDFLSVYRLDDGIWWRLECGHHQNLLDEAITRLETAERPASPEGDGPSEFED